MEERFSLIQNLSFDLPLHQILVVQLRDYDLKLHPCWSQAAISFLCNDVLFIVPGIEEPEIGKSQIIGQLHPEKKSYSLYRSYLGSNSEMENAVNARTYSMAGFWMPWY